MKYCCRRSTTCIIFASFYIAAGIFITISSIISMFDTNYTDEEHKRNNDIASNLKNIKKITIKIENLINRQYLIKSIIWLQV